MILLGLTACNGIAISRQQDSGESVPDWTKDANIVIFRLDQTVDGEPQIDAFNRLPRCTIYGNGHVIWANSIPSGGEQILEARIDDATLRAFLEFVVRDKKFYSIPDYAAQKLPSPNTPVVESITLNLNQEVRTVRNFEQWPGDEFDAMLSKCTTLTAQPVLYVPAGAWVTVYATDRTDLSQIPWQPIAEFKLADIAASRTAIWATGAALAQLWTFQHQTPGNVQWNENDKYYRVIIQVPGLSRDAPPAPTK